MPLTHARRPIGRRAIALLEHVVETRGEIFGYARTLMLGRWERLEQIFVSAARLPSSLVACPLFGALPFRCAPFSVRSLFGALPFRCAPFSVRSSHRGDPHCAQAGSAYFRLEPRDAPARDSWSGQDNYPASPAYAWIERLDGRDALAALAGVGVVGRNGTVFGAAKRFVRVELLMREATFQVRARR